MKAINVDTIFDFLRSKEGSELLEHSICEFVAIKELIDKIPTIEAEPVRHGKWIKKRFGIYICSECGVIHIPILSKPNKRCPKCEAKMDGKEADNR